MTQRDKMRELFRLYQGDKAMVVKAYAEAEQAGEVNRLRNASGYGTEQYARALWADGEKKGWLPQGGPMPPAQNEPRNRFISPLAPPAPPRDTTRINSEQKPASDPPADANLELLIDAAIRGDLKSLRAALAQGIHPDAKDGEGDTALMLAAYNGHVDIVAALLEAKADLWIKDRDGKTATDLAVSKGNVEVVRLLEQVRSSRPQKRAAQKEADQKPCMDQLQKELDGLIGLNVVKAYVKEKINLIELQKMREKEGLPATKLTSHLVFSGNPGTGKTTVARLIAEIYKCLGLLNRGHLVEVQAKDLVAEYVGQTSAKTAEVIESAIGGVLFLDEAYSLLEIPHYGQEAIETLLPALSNRSDELVVIVAGYPDKMKQFISSNPGIKRRFPETIEFDDYMPDDLTCVFLKCAEKHQMNLTEEATEKVAARFDVLYRGRTKEFGNAGEAITLFQKAVTKQSNRLARLSFVDRAALMTLLPEDIPGE